MKHSLISLFAGIGGLDLAAHWAGFETIRFVEKEPFCQEVLAKHWPNVPIDNDVFTSHPEYADIICGGFPCQPFSVAGNRQGRGDKRFLLPEMLRIVDEVKPYAVLFENVPGFPSLTDGRAFKYLLGTLAEMGFNAEWGHIRASDIGAPHQRERWFCVAYTTSAGLEGRNGSEPALGEHTEHAETVVGNTERGGRNRITRGRSGAQLADGYPQSGRRQAQSKLRGAAHGLPGRLDFVGFPARPNQSQYPYEPPRTALSTKETTSRIKALGNAVVPQAAYPLFAAIAEWLTEIKTNEGVNI